MALLASISGDEEEAEDTAAKTAAVLDLLGTEARLRSKRDLIEEFIGSSLPGHRGEERMSQAFWEYWSRKRSEAFDALCAEAVLDPQRFTDLPETCQFSDKDPLTDETIEIVRTPPGILRRKKTTARIILRMVDHIETLDENVGDIDSV